MASKKGRRAEHGSETAAALLVNRNRVLNWITPFASTYWLLLTVALLGTPSSKGYTLDTTNHVMLKPDDTNGESMFGYTIGFWNETNWSSSLLVGAPDWSRTEKGGALFKCRLDTMSPQCRTVEVDLGNETCHDTPNSECNDIADFQRLGATLAVQDGIVLVCAPNWKYVHKNKYNKKTGTIVGKCFYSDNALTKFTSFSPPYDIKPESTPIYYYTTGYCQAGFSAFLLPEENKVALGSPGCYNWIGDVLVGVPGNKSYTTRGDTYSSSADFGVDSSEPDPEPFNRYMGYSIARGTFNNKQAVVTGAPRASISNFMEKILSSSVTVMEQHNSETLRIWKQLYPPMGDKDWYFSYCGHSVAVGDLNGDGLDDVAVGCPNYDDDKGAVLIYYQIKEADGSFKMELEAEPETGAKYRMGTESGARFGSSVTVLEDMDGDGFQELAVGSPFTSEGNSSGRLYIYCSEERTPLPMTPCQEVAAPIAAANGDEMRTFGWSVAASGSKVAVAAPASDAVLVYSTLPVVQLSVNITATDELDVGQHCSMTSGEDAPCVNVTVCLQYSIRNGPQNDRLRDMVVDVELERSDTLYFGDGSKSSQVNFNSMVDTKNCKKLLVYDRKKTEAIAEYKIIARGSFTPAQGDTVVLDTRQGLESNATLRMKVDCKDSTYDTCTPDVRVSIRQDGEFVLGVEDSVRITVTVTVSGDPAYYPKLALSSAGFMVPSDYSVEGGMGRCTVDGQTHDMVCSLGGVLQDTKTTVALSLSGSTKFYNNQKFGDDFFTVMVSAYCSSTIKEPNDGNDTKRVDISVKPEKLVLSRTQYAEELDLNKWTEEPSSTLESKGPPMKHSYEVDNPNPYSLYGVSLTICWPQKHKEGYMLYTTKAPTIQRNNEETGYCVAVAGGDFDEKRLYDSNTTETGITKKPSIICSGEQLGAADIQPLTIECILGDITPDDSIVVEVESYAFYQTFTKMEDDPVSSIKSIGVVTPETAPLGKIFTTNTTESITTNVTYPRAPTHWWWYLIGVVVGLFLIITMAILFKKYCIDKKKNNDGVDGATEGEEKEEAEEPLNRDQVEDTTNM